MPFPILGQPKQAFFDSSGSPLVSGTLSILDPADDTNKASYPTYDDAVALTNANTNPLVLDGRGEPTGASVGLWGLDGEDYKVVLKDSTGATIWTTDDINLQIAVPYGITADETSFGLTVSDLDRSYAPGDVWRYKPTGDGSADDYQAFANAIGSSGYVFTSKPPPTRWKIGTTLTWTRNYQNIDIHGNIEYTGGATTGLFKVQGGYTRAQVTCHGEVYGDGTNYCVYYEWGINNKFSFNYVHSFDICFACIQAVGGQAANHSLVENIIEYQLLYGASVGGTTSNYGLLFRNTTGDSAIPCEGFMLRGGFIASMQVDGIIIEENTNAKYLHVEGSIDFCVNKDYNCAGSQQQSSLLLLKYIRPAFLTLGDGDTLINAQDASITINSVTPESTCFDFKAAGGTSQPTTGAKYIGTIQGGDDGTEEYTTVLAGTGSGLDSSAATNIQAYYKPGTTATPASTEAKESGLLATFRRNDDASAIKGGTAEFQKRAATNTVDLVVGLANAATHGAKFIVKGDGGIGISNSVADTSALPANATHKIPIYDEAGVFLCYLIGVADF